jgi:hypothetical protein
MIAALAGTVFGQGATAWNIQARPTERWLSGAVNDPAWNWMREIDALVAASGGTSAGTGSTFYVDSGVTNEGDGSSWANARDTLDEAVAYCTANNGDRILVAQGHNESLSGADGVDLDVAGITVIGIGEGSDRPRFDFDAGAAEFVIGAPAVRIVNLTFLPSADSVVHAIDVENAADWALIENCEFLNSETANTDEFDDAIQIGTTATDVWVVNCKQTYTSSSVEANTFVDLSAATISRPRIIGNYVYGGFDDAPIFGAAAVPTECIIANNVITNTESGDLAIEFTGNATGWIVGNLVSTDAIASSIDAGRMGIADNQWADFDTYDATAVPYTTNHTGVNRWGASELAQIEAEATDAIEADELQVLVNAADADNPADDSLIAKITSSAATADFSTFDNTTDSLQAIRDSITALSGVQYSGTCTVDANGATQFSSDIEGFGNDYFNTHWVAICLYDASGAGTAPEGEVRDITDYVSASGVVTVGTAFSAQLTTGDLVMLKRIEDMNLNDPAALGSSSALWYVDDGGSGGDGKSWETALTTIQAAETLASAGDVILVGRSHNENILGAGDITVDVAGLSIIGMGQGFDRALIDFDDNTAVITIDAPGCLIENLAFRPGATVVAIGVRVEDEALGTIIRNCAFVDGEGADEEFVDCITVDSLASDLLVEGCTYGNINQTAGDTNTFVNLDEATIADATVRACAVYGDFAEACIWGAAAVPTNILIKDNVLANTNSGDMAIEFAGAATGVISGNHLYTDAFATMLDPGSAICVENYGSAAINEQAIRIPVSADTSTITVDDDGSNLERLEFLQTKVSDILAGIKMAGGSVGDVFYCDDGGDGGDGTTWATAEQTLDAAWNATTANVGDIIFVAPSHDETLGAAQIACDTAGVTIIGIGLGDEIPQIVFDDATSSIDVTASGVVIKGLNFHSTTAACTIGVDVDAGDFTMEDCLFTDAGDFEFAISLDLGATAENATVKNTRFNSLRTHTGASSAIAVTGGVVDRLTVEGCHITGDFTNAGIYSDQINTNVLIKDNTVYNNSSSNHAIELSAASTGELVNNMLAASAYGTVLDPGSLRCFGNKQSIGIDAAAEDIPLVAGRTYARAMLTGDLNASDNLFSVTGSPIIVKSFIGKCTVACGGATTLKIFCDADDTWDYDISTSVDVDTVDAGGNLAFTSVINESVLTVQPVGASGSLAAPIQWWVEEGMLESTVDAGGSTGDIEWYMIFTPVESGGEVIPQ